jgi:hypothetical protein
VKGTFFRQERCVVVYDFDSLAKFRHILFHEIDHYVFYWLLDIAESYACFLMDRAALLRNPRKHEFMRCELFSTMAALNHAPCRTQN